LIQQKYRALTPKEMKQWIDAAAFAKKIHEQMYPGYRCAPRKSSAIKKRKKVTRVSQELVFTSVPIEFEGNLQLFGANEDATVTEGTFIEPSIDESAVDMEARGSTISEEVSEEESEVSEADIEDEVVDEEDEFNVADLAGNFDEDF